MTGESGPDNHASSRLTNDAAALVQRVRSDPTEENVAACKAWCDQGDEYRKAFASVMLIAPLSDEVRRRIGTMVGERFPALDGLPSGNHFVPAAKRATAGPGPWETTRPTAGLSPPPHRRVGRVVWIGVGAAASAAVLALAIGLGPNLSTESLLSSARAEILETGHGAIRSYSLADGSGVTLDADTRLEITMDHAHRHALLRQGRARFTVKSDRRPFTVEVAGGEIVADQGSIDVQLDRAHRADIRLREGAATVRSDGQDARSLTIGQPLTFSQDNPRATTVASPPADTRDWPAGWVEYRTVSLGALIAEANRYSRVPIVLDSPDLETLQATGRFKLTDTDTFVSRIAEPFGLRVSRRSDGIHLSR
ncbi:hypothetical protein F9288_12485 [Sphingomonas sp. CL5.1]|uniref:FecR family protein n=1 Tax=Sphingomonas sp. CL5.1 TaxID=2653203 RepID=UPI0015827431|nr:FecR domain-containing protein [Sphingomonas sp. CL5.1]QKS00353.1 hypothetical protein F9288_12485 [Sphingomonas sp. CL5.1]